MSDTSHEPPRRVAPALSGRVHGRRPRLLAGLTRARVLAALRNADHALSVHELAGELGLHPNSVREQLDLLVDGGHAERTTASPLGRGRGRPAHRFRAAPETDEAASYRDLARVLADELARVPDAATRAVAAGERWGRTAVRPGSAVVSAPEHSAPGPVERLVEVLDASGFAPEMPAAGDPIRLRRCPFVPLANERPAIVCGVHLGLMRGALAEIGGPLDAVRLEPFVESDLCLAHLAPRAPEAGR